MTTTDPFLAPWTLHFDRDGTEDVAYLVDADGYDLAVSRPFWLPEPHDPVPPTLAAVRLMAAAPALFHALDALLWATEAVAPPAAGPDAGATERARTDARAALAVAVNGLPRGPVAEPPPPTRPSTLTRRIEVEWVEWDPSDA